MVKNIIIIPIYNESRVIGRTIGVLHKFLLSKRSPGVYWEIVVADNASSDGSKEIVAELSNKLSKKVKIGYEYIPQKGRGNAIKQVVKHHKAEYYYYSDVDLPFKLPDLLKIQSSLKNNDIVVGRRSGKRPTLRKFLTFSYRVISNILFDLRVSDPQCGLKGFNYKVASKLLNRCRQVGYFLDTELLVLGKFKGLKVSEVDITWLESRFSDRPSKISAVKDSFGAIYSLSSIANYIYPDFIRNYIAFLAFGLLTLATFAAGKWTFGFAGYHPALHIPSLATMLQVQVLIFATLTIYLLILIRIIKKFPWRLIATTTLVFFIPIAIISLFTPPTGSADGFWNLFLVKGYVTQGMNPYTTTPFMIQDDTWFSSVAAWQGLQMTHGPLWIWFLYIPAAFSSIFYALLFAKSFVLLAVLVTAFLLWKLAGLYKLTEKKKAFIITFFLLSPFVIQNTLVDMHNDVLVMLFVTLALYMYKNRLFALSFLSLLCGGLVKYAPLMLLVVPFFGLLFESNMSNRRKIYEIVFIISAGIVIITLVSTPFLDGLKTMPGLQNEMLYRSSPQFSLPGAYILGVLKLQPIIIRLVGFIIGFILTLYFTIKKKELLAFSIPMLLLFLIGTPWFQAWYVLWIYPTLLLYVSFNRIAVLNIFLDRKSVV